VPIGSIISRRCTTTVLRLRVRHRRRRRRRLVRPTVAASIRIASAAAAVAAAAAVRIAAVTRPRVVPTVYGIVGQIELVIVLSIACLMGFGLRTPSCSDRGHSGRSCSIGDGTETRGMNGSHTVNDWPRGPSQLVGHADSLLIV